MDDRLPTPESKDAQLERERREGLQQICANYLGAEDVEFIDEMDDEGEVIGYIYDTLLELGEDPDMILKEFSVTEGEETDEV